jgi:hypothetical protein
VTVTGHTKSGKTVLVRKVLPRTDAVWIDGGAVGEENDFWTTIIDQLELFQGDSISESDDIATEISGSIKAGASAIIAKAEGQLGGSIGTNRNRSSVRVRQVSSRARAIAGLREAVTPVVIDDFHYLPRDLQGNVVRALKPLIFDGLPVVIIAIPHRRYDAVKVEREMTGRILSVVIPAWSPDELKFIPEAGFPLLDSYISPEISRGLADESLGSPHLMQEFCRAVCKAHGITNSFEGKCADIDNLRLKAIFEETAESIGRPIFEKLSRGPRQRTDRIQRQLKTGVEVDRYGLVLHALAYLRPALVTLEYEGLRSAIRDVSAQEIPQLHEVSRVLKHMSDIAATDESSTAVIDFDEDEKVLHVTDPFFAFYLRWGNLTR